MFTSSLFLPVSLEHFLTFPPVLSSTSTPPVSPDKWRETSLDSQNIRHGEDFCSPCLLETESESSVPMAEGRPVRTLAAPPQAVRTPRCPFSPALPTSQKAWTLWLPMANWPQQGYRQAGKEKHRLEDLLHMSTRCQLSGQCSLGLHLICVHGSAKHFRVTGVGPRGTPVLCCAS